MYPCQVLFASCALLSSGCARRAEQEARLISDALPWVVYVSTSTEVEKVEVLVQVSVMWCDAGVW